MKENEYPSSAEIDKHLAPVLDELRKATLYAEYEDPATSPIHYRSLVREKSDSGCNSTPSRSSGSAMLNDQFEFMRDIFQHASDGLKAHYDRLRWGIERGNRILRDVKSAGYVTLNEMRMGHGGR